MILLIAGATETARSVLVESFLSRHADWRHLALEDLREEEPWDEENIDMEDVFGTMVACKCAQDVHNEGHPVVVTCPALSLVETVREAFPERVVSVYMGAGNGAEKEFDYIIDTKALSANAAYNMLKNIVGK